MGDCAMYSTRPGWYSGRSSIRRLVYIMGSSIGRSIRVRRFMLCHKCGRLRSLSHTYKHNAYPLPLFLYTCLILPRIHYTISQNSLGHSRQTYNNIPNNYTIGTTGAYRAFMLHNKTRNTLEYPLNRAYTGHNY